MIVVADTSPLISLIIINKLTILEKIFGTFYIPKGVYDELKGHNEINLYKEELEYLATKVKSTQSVYIPISGIDKGETECIILYKELNADLLIIDDRKAREIAELLGMKCTGTLAILLKAKELNYIAELKPIFNTLLENSRYYSKKILNELLAKVGETNL